MSRNTEGGLLPSRIEMIAEETVGVTPSDPSWQMISDRVTDFEPEFGPEAVDKAGTGQHDNEYAEGLEENELTISYDLQRWFYDGSGDANDLSAYGMFRSASGRLPGTVSIVERAATHEDGEGSPNAAASTVHADYIGDGAAGPRHSHLYTVARGGLVDELTLEGDPEEVYWAVEASLLVKNGRSYQFDQPSNSNPLNLESRLPGGGVNNADTGLTVEIEDEGATTTESINLDGNDASNTVTTTSSFDSIDAIQTVDGQTDHAGDILIWETEGTDTDGDGNVDSYENAQLLGVLYGNRTYKNTHGDYGVPTLGSGSHASEIGQTITGTDYFAVGNSLVERPYGSAFEEAGSVNTIEIELENDSESSPDNRSRENAYHPGMRSAEVTLACDGETVSHRAMKQAAVLEKLDTRIQFARDGSLNLELPDAPMGEGGRGRSAAENALEQEFVIMSGLGGIDASTP